MALNTREVTEHLETAAKVRQACLNYHSRLYGTTITPGRRDRPRTIRDSDITNVRVEVFGCGCCECEGWITYTYKHLYKEWDDRFPVSELNMYL